MRLHYRLRDIDRDLNYERQRKTRGADTTITAAAANCLLLPYSPPLSPVVFIEQTVTQPRDLRGEQFKKQQEMETQSTVMIP
jgi:hypothetical protein